MGGFFNEGSSIEIFGVRSRMRWVLGICVKAMISVRTVQVDP